MSEFARITTNQYGRGLCRCDICNHLWLKYVQQFCTFLNRLSLQQNPIGSVLVQRRRQRGRLCDSGGSGDGNNDDIGGDGNNDNMW